MGERSKPLTPRNAFLRVLGELSVVGAYLPGWVGSSFSTSKGPLLPQPPFGEAGPQIVVQHASLCTWQGQVAVAAHEVTNDPIARPGKRERPLHCIGSPC